MKENLLLKIALICSIAGIVLLFFISNSIKLEEREISTLKPDEDVLVKGRIEKIFEKEDFMIITLSREETVDVVLFNADLVDLQQGYIVEVKGETKEYKDRIEIIGDEVRVVG